MELPSRSFDYEVVERARGISVLPYVGMWKDLGTWDALVAEMDEPVLGNAWIDESSVRDVYVINETDTPLVVADLSHAIVTVTSEGMLVSGLDGSNRIKGLVEEAERTRNVG